MFLVTVFVSQNRNTQNKEYQTHLCFDMIMHECHDKKVFHVSNKMILFVQGPSWAYFQMEQPILWVELTKTAGKNS